MDYVGQKILYFPKVIFHTLHKELAPCHVKIEVKWHVYISRISYKMEISA